MSGVLHPVGPESASTYWLRRALVLGVLAVLLASVIGLVRWATPQSAVPAAPPPASPTAQQPSGPASPTSSTALGTPSPGAASASPTSSLSSARTSPPATAPSRAPLPPPVACVPSAVTVTLTGKQSLRPKEANTFFLAVVNNSRTPCRVIIRPTNFELKVYSGRDRIWSSADCPASVRPIDATVASRRAVAWQLRWNGLRSAARCQNRAQVPQPGTYYATAQLTGAKPVQLIMILRG